MKKLKFTYKNGNELIQRNVNNYEIADNKLYMSIYNGLSNEMLIIKLDNIIIVEEL